jgi:hypothetical protein
MVTDGRVPDNVGLAAGGRAAFRAIAASHTRFWLPSGWRCRGRRTLGSAANGPSPTDAFCSLPLEKNPTARPVGRPEGEERVPCRAHKFIACHGRVKFTVI